MFFNLPRKHLNQSLGVLSCPVVRAKSGKEWRVTAHSRVQVTGPGLTEPGTFGD